MKKFTLSFISLVAALSASAQVTPPADSSIQYYTRTGSFYNVDWDGVTVGTQSGCIGVVVDGNDVYFENLVAAINNDSWVKGTMGEDGKTITIPSDNILMTTSQWIEMPDGDWSEFSGYMRLSMLKYEPSKNGGLPSFVRDADTPITLTLDGDNITLENTAAEKEMLGAINDGFTDEAAYLNGTWNVGADFGTTMTKFNEKPVAVPAEAVGTQYQMRSIGAYSSDVEYGFVTVYNVGDDVYVQGFYSGEKSYAFKGTRQGDKVHFDAPQFVGISSGYILEVTSCTYTKTEPDEWGWSDISFEDKGSFDLTYDETTGTYTLPQGEALRLTVRGQSAYSWAMYCDVTLTPYVDKLLTPSEPVITDVGDYWELEGDWGVFFEYSTTSVDGEPLNTEHLSYCFYINGEPYTFDAARYGLEEDLTEIPINMSGNSFLNIATYWGIQNYIQEQNIWKVGVQFVYRVGDEVSRSTINEYICGEEPTAIRSINGDDDLNANCYNLTGQHVKASAKGIIIRNGRMILSK